MESQGSQIMLQGRIVWVSGDLFKGKPKVDQNTNQPVLDQHGNQKMEYGFGLAVPKTHIQEMWNLMYQEAYQIYPSGNLPPDFAFKFKDGDTVDHNGVPFAQREGYAGNLVFALTTQIPIKYFKQENGAFIAINEGIKCGDYVEVQVQVKAHGPVGRGKAGLYLNPLAVLFLGYGKEIINTPSGEQIFGNHQRTLPPGASATPVGTGQPLVPSEMGQQMTPPPQGSPIQPNYEVLPPQHQPQQTAPPPQGAPMPQMGNAPSAQAASQPPMPTGAPSVMPGSAPTAFPSNGMPPMPGMPR